MGAPIIIEAPKDFFDPIKLATMEYEMGIVPITVRRESKVKKAGT
jgi:DNA-directed RNA polymerase subunit K/omega